MALCTAQAVPAIRTQRSAENCPIVWIAGARDEQRQVVEKRVAHPFAPIAFAHLEEPAAGDRLFSNSLYQRPPPFALL